MFNQQIVITAQGLMQSGAACIAYETVTSPNRSLPLLKPTTFFVLVTSIIGSFQVFTFVYVMTEGGPLHATDVIVYHIYQNAWQFLRMGYASAMSWVLFGAIFVITLLQFRFMGRRMEPS